VSIDELRSAAFGPGRAGGTTPVAGDAGRRHSGVGDAERVFDEALARLDLASAVASLLARNDADPDLEWSRSASRLARVAEAAETLGHRAELVGPLTETLLEIRRNARNDRDWAAADAIRDRLRSLGIEIHDADEATTWSIERGATVEVAGGR
jgi:hypothetical protein